MLTAARLTVDLDALAANLQTLRAQADGAEVAPVVKADGYGLGIGPVGRRLWAEGVRSFFVAHVHEGEALRGALDPGADAQIYVLDGLVAGTSERLAASGLTPVLSSVAQAAAAAGFRRPVALHIDTGMNRQGVSPVEARCVTHIDVQLLMSHLGSAADSGSDRNGVQLARFNDARALFPQARASLSASAGVFLGPEYRFDMVRPGVSLYGGGPAELPDGRIRAVATLEAPILDIREVPAGEMLGYGAAMILPRPTRIALVAAGYAHGLIRSAKNGATAWAAGAHRPFLIVNMNLLALDLGDARAQVGDTVELVGPNALLDDLANAAGTVAHECLVRLGSGVERVYLGRV